jgi:hypothetical protein
MVRIRELEAEKENRQGEPAQSELNSLILVHSQLTSY